MKKDNIDLICSIGELSGLFEKRSTVNEFLGDVVQLVADHMRSDVCSIYLYDEHGGDLVLQATRGLNPRGIGTVRLKLDEGITGLALKELRPIREAMAADNPSFKVVPEVEEEAYQAFLAVPIRRGLKRIGVITLQHRKSGYFDDQDSKALKAIASQLAATLENAGLLMDLHRAHENREKRTPPGPGSILSGQPASPGYARGMVFQLDRQDSRAAAETLPAHRAFSLEDFDRAVDEAQEQLEHLQRETEELYSDVATLIFSSHLLMLRDLEFTGRMRELIDAGTNADEAISEVVQRYVELFAGMEDPRIREKAQDVRDLGHRITRNLMQEGPSSGDYEGQVVVAHEVFPSELVKLLVQHAEGLVLSGAGFTAHIAILARSLGLPVLFTRESGLFEIPEGTPVIVDCHSGQLHVQPSETLEARYLRLVSDARDRSDEPEAVPAEARTRCKTHIRVQANVNLIRDVEEARKFKAEGIGLYRSEFPFIVRNDFPSEEEQFTIYQKVIGSQGAGEVVMRTLDVGGDKILQYLPDWYEANPFLGLRGIRFSLAHRDLFVDQLRAMLRAGVGADLRILFPMISSVDEYDDARGVVADCLEDMRVEGIEHNPSPKVGALIELPSAIESVTELNKHADFLCVGTNDLVMYVVGVDRTNYRVGNLYRNFHPAVLRALKRIVDGMGRDAHKLSICGEAGADPALIPFFVGLGVRKISVDPRALGRVKGRIGEISVAESKRITRQMLGISSLRDMEAYLAELAPES